MDWPDYGMALARTAALKSKDPSTKVGCAVLAVDNSVASMGFNGLPMNVPDADRILRDRQEKYRWVLHAELNALLLARKDLTGSTLYATLFPCSGCAKAIIQAGIDTVVAPPYVPERWEEDCRASLRMFTAAGVEVDFYVGEGNASTGREGTEEPGCDLRREPSVPGDA